MTRWSLLAPSHDSRVIVALPRAAGYLSWGHVCLRWQHSVYFRAMCTNGCVASWARR